MAITEPKYNYSRLKAFLGNNPIITFVGSGHAPNLDACEFIINNLAPQTPEYIYCIIFSILIEVNNDFIFIIFNSDK